MISPTEIEIIEGKYALVVSSITYIGKYKNIVEMFAFKANIFKLLFP